MVLDFTTASGLDPADPARARAVLPGGQDHNWT